MCGANFKKFPYIFLNFEVFIKSKKIKSAGLNNSSFSFALVEIKYFTNSILFFFKRSLYLLHFASVIKVFKEIFPLNGKVNKSFKSISNNNNNKVQVKFVWQISRPPANGASLDRFLMANWAIYTN